ncbi:hypothetical protein N9M68_02170 [Candidatus Poseidonia alphae]|nr:hypothetical protein [Candidatus Poseidonia alphae]
MITEIIEQLEQLPYEEWLSEIEMFLENDVDLCHQILMHIAINHEDSSWRFNAIQILIDANLLHIGDTSTILDSEQDEEIIELLQNTL